MRVGEFAKFAFAIFTGKVFMTTPRTPDRRTHTVWITHTGILSCGPTCPLPSTLREVCSHRATEPALAGGRRAVRL